VRIETGENDGRAPTVWEIPEAIGPAALSLSRAARAVIGELRLMSAWNPHDAQARIAGHSEGPRLLGVTLIGGTVDGVQITRAVLDGIELDPDRCLEPWYALIDAWARMGFFGPGLRRQVLQALEKTTETPTSDSPTPSS
jgi:hypothetical protein